MDAEFLPAMAAIAGGELDELERLLDADPGLLTRASSVSHPSLLQFIACNDADLQHARAAAEILVARGASLAGPLVAAAGCEGWAVLRLAKARGHPFDVVDAWSPLDEALYWDKVEVVRFLLDEGAKPHSLRAAAALGDLEALDVFWEDKGPIRSPFADTVPDDRAFDRQDIIDNAFVSAAVCGQRESARVLLDRGARINSRPPGFHWRGSALHAVSWRGHVALAKWLLDEGADRELVDEQHNATPLGWAEHHGHQEMIAFLSRAVDG